MDFDIALAAKTTSERNELIEDQIEEYDWTSEVEELLVHGGWPDDGQAENVTIKDNPDGSILVTVFVTANESTPTACKDHNRDFPIRAYYFVDIDPSDGSWELRCGNHQHGEPYGTGFADQPDLYPGDYN